MAFLILRLLWHRFRLLCHRVLANFTSFFKFMALFNIVVGIILDDYGIVYIWNLLYSFLFLVQRSLQPEQICL